MSEAPKELWADWDYEATDGVCGVHTHKKYASGYEPECPPIRYVRADRIEELSNCVAVLETKLAKAVAIAKDAIETMECGPFFPDREGQRLLAALAELKGRGVKT